LSWLKCLGFELAVAFVVVACEKDCSRWFWGAHLYLVGEADTPKRSMHYQTTVKQIFHDLAHHGMYFLALLPTVSS